MGPWPSRTHARVRGQMCERAWACAVSASGGPILFWMCAVCALVCGCADCVRSRQVFSVDALRAIGEGFIDEFSMEDDLAQARHCWATLMATLMAQLARDSHHDIIEQRLEEDLRQMRYGV